MEYKKKNLALIAIAAIAITLDTGEAFGVPAPVAIAVPATGDGSVAIVCGILAYMLPRSIQCSTISTAGDVKAFDISPNATFLTISSGRDSICGLQSGGTDYFCWRHARIGKDYTLQNIYENSVAALRDLAVGEMQIAAIEERNKFVRLWRNESSFPTRVSGHFRSLTSGAGFFCAIDEKNKSACWGPKAQQINSAFDGQDMSAIYSGESHACGITTEGRVICGGNNDHGQSSPPEYPPFEFEGLALGSTHTCAVRGPPSRTVVCWGVGEREYCPTGPAGNGSFTFLAANGNLTCGLRWWDSAVICWWTSTQSHKAQAPEMVKLPLRREVIMGLCTGKCSCPCGSIEQSMVLCADYEVICKPFCH